MNRTPYTKKDFTWTAWTPEDIKKLVPEIITKKKERLAVIKKVAPRERTFINTVYALEASNHGLTDIILKIDLLQNVSPDKKIRDTAQKAIQSIEKELISIERDQKIWEALKEYEAMAWRTERTRLELSDKKLFRTIFLDYRRMGFALPTQKQKRLKILEQELSRFSNEFRGNINKHTDHILATEQELEGLPERYRQGLKKDKQGCFIVTLAYPDYVPFMELAKDEKKRKELSEKYLQKGGLKNMEVLKKMLAIRAEHATLLGYKNHADYKTELRMAKSSDTAMKFSLDLLKKVEKGGMHDLNELRALKQKATGNKKAVLFPHDVAYYGHELQKIRFKFNSEEVRAYFPLERVLEGTFKIYSTLFGVNFKKVTRISLWHADTELYEITTPKGDVISYFALDLYPREGKYGHAAAFGIIGGRAVGYTGDEYVAPFATMVTNFPKPSPKNPSLLSHGEVETFLHEFGHIMHFTLTTARHVQQAGYNTAWDFVEAPSQMLEHWAWDKKPVNLLSAHYKTNAPLPNALLKNLLASKQHLLRYATMRQLVMGIFDLTLHSKRNPLDANKLYINLIKKYTGLSMPKGSIFPAGFGHLDGYDAGYYGYMWSNVYAADMFTRFEKEGILNKKTGGDYKKWILEKGGSIEELDLVRGFLGRAPSNKAFLKEIGALK